ncbi:MAG: response regulator [Acidobacteria bacterium]|nr:response regulator [Acidobacteriota bacterium]
MEGDVHVATEIVIGRGCDGTEAIEIVQRLQPDLVGMDVDMPSIDGLTAALIITTHFPSVQVLLMSAEDSRELLADWMACGAAAFIHKARFRQEFQSFLELTSDSK